jgi:hypothetical protein
VPTKKEESDNKASRSKGEIQSDMAQTRARLVENIEKLKAETTPKALFARVKGKAVEVFVNPETGEIRRERVAGVAVGVVGIIVVRRGLKSRAKRKHLEYLRTVVWVPVPKVAVSPEVAKVARIAAELAPGPAVPVITAENLAAGQVPLALEAGN